MRHGRPLVTVVCIELVPIPAIPITEAVYHDASLPNR